MPESYLKPDPLFIEDRFSFEDGWSLAQKSDKPIFIWKGKEFSTATGRPVREENEGEGGLASLKAMMSLDENNQNLPPWTDKLRQLMSLAGSKARTRFEDEGYSEEEAAALADRARHVEGMRWAAKDPEIGPWKAMLAGLGHEIVNLREDVDLGKLVRPGVQEGELPLRSILSGGAADLFNNAVGALSTYTHPEVDPSGSYDYEKYGIIPDPIDDTPGSYRDRYEDEQDQEHGPIGMWMGGPVDRTRYR